MLSSNSNHYTLIAMYVGGPKHTVDNQRSQWKQTEKTCWCISWKHILQLLSKAQPLRFPHKAMSWNRFLTNRNPRGNNEHYTSIHRLGRIVIRRCSCSTRYFESWPCRDICNHFPQQLILWMFCFSPPAAAWPESILVWQSVWFSRWLLFATWVRLCSRF